MAAKKPTARCVRNTAKGNRCKRAPVVGTKYCFAHTPAKRKRKTTTKPAVKRRRKSGNGGDSRVTASVTPRESGVTLSEEQRMFLVTCAARSTPRHELRSGWTEQFPGQAFPSRVALMRYRWPHVKAHPKYAQLYEEQQAIYFAETEGLPFAAKQSRIDALTKQAEEVSVELETAPEARTETKVQDATGSAKMITPGKADKRKELREILAQLDKEREGETFNLRHQGADGGPVLIEGTEHVTGKRVLELLVIAKQADGEDDDDTGHSVA